MSILLNGAGVSKGIAIGEAYVYSREQNEISEHKVPESQQKNEIQRFKQALSMAADQLHDIKKQIAADTPPDILAFIDTHLLMLEDPAFNEGTISNIREYSCNAEWGLQIQSDRLVPARNSGRSESPDLRRRE